MNLLDETLKRYFDTTLKFNYFILSATLAVLGLSIQIINPTRANVWPSLVFFSWGCLLLSLICGLIWQTSWIKIQGEIHSELLAAPDLRKIPKKLILHLGISWVSQIIFFIFGILFIGAFKVINFYFGPV